MPEMTIPPISGLQGHPPTIVYPVAASGMVPRNTLEPTQLRIILGRLDRGFYGSAEVMDRVTRCIVSSLR